MLTQHDAGTQGSVVTQPMSDSGMGSPKKIPRAGRGWAEPCRESAQPLHITS